MRTKREDKENRVKQINFRMKDEDFAKLKNYAIGREQSVADTIRIAIACEIGLAIK